jgi:hypothetical protein
MERQKRTPRKEILLKIPLLIGYLVLFGVVDIFMLNNKLCPKLKKKKTTHANIHVC